MMKKLRPKTNIRNKYLRHVAPYKQNEKRWWIASVVLPILSILFGSGGLVLFVLALFSQPVSGSTIQPANSTPNYIYKVEAPIQNAAPERGYVITIPYPTYTFYPTYTQPSISITATQIPVRTITLAKTETPTITGTVVPMPITTNAPSLQSTFKAFQIETLQVEVQQTQQSVMLINIEQQAELERCQAELERRRAELESLESMIAQLQVKVDRPQVEVDQPPLAKWLLFGEGRTVFLFLSALVSLLISFWLFRVSKRLDR